MAKRKDNKENERQRAPALKSRARKKREKRVKRHKKIWTEEEDVELLKLIKIYGPSKWSVIANFMSGRQGKQCRERWYNHLNPDILKCDWREEEEWKLFLLHRLYGNKWAILSQMIAGRTDNSIKNHWNSIMRRKIKFYESRLKEMMDKSDQSDLSKFEQILINRISNGEFDNKSSRKGRKRNYNNFFEKNQLQEFVVKKAEKEEFSSAKKSEEFNISLEYDVYSPARFNKMDSYPSLFNTKTPNEELMENKNIVKITSFNKLGKFSVSGGCENENVMLNRYSEMSLSKTSNFGFRNENEFDKRFDTSNMKFMGFRTPEKEMNIIQGIRSLKKLWIN